MVESWRFNLMAITITLIMSALLVAGADDKEDCTEQLVGLATCLPYVQEQAKSPTPDCCSGLKQILNSNMKCLCVVIQNRNDPDLGLKVNVSLALALPSVCHATADITKCPALLHLDPNSKDAQVFYQLGKGNLNNTTGPASAPSGLAPELSSMPPTAGFDNGKNSTRRTPSVPRTNHAQSIYKQWLGLEVVAHFFVILYIFILV